MNYSDLKTNIASWLNRSNLTSVIPTFITLAEGEFNRTLRTTDMQAYASDTFSSSTLDLSSVLTRYLDLRAVSINTGATDYPLQYISPDQFFATYPSTTSGICEYYTMVGQTMYLDPAPADTYTWKIFYNQALQPLSDSVSTNWLLTSHPDIYLVGAQYQASIYLKKPEAASFKQLQDNLLRQLRVRDIMGRGSNAKQRTEMGVV